MGRIVGFTEMVMVLANMAIAALGAAMNGESKITESHLDRQAVVYVRQSSLAQVRDHSESTARQYALTEAATRLGWPTARVAVIDADLGLSGRDAHSRSGLQDLVGRVCVGQVGVILALEVSRLARSSADFARLPGAGPVVRHAAGRRRRRLRPARLQRPADPGAQEHDQRG